MTRKEGWTEIWGNKECDDRQDGNGTYSSPVTSSRYATVLKDGCDYVGGGSPSVSDENTNDDGKSLTLTQHRPAWLEQLLLRICHIPHNVQNSSYSAEESTGALPRLLDTRCGQITNRNHTPDLSTDTSEWPKKLKQMNKPVMVGRHHPGGLGSSFYTKCKDFNTAPESFLPSGSHIIDYLRLTHDEVPSQILFDCHEMLPYATLVQEKLNYILLALRYGNDPAWEMIYKSQYAQASLDPNAQRLSSRSDKTRSGFFSFWTWYQTYSERALALHNLLPSSCSMHPSTHNGLSLELFSYNDHRYSNKGTEDDESDAEQEDGLHQHHPFSRHFPSYAGVGGGDTGKVNVYRAMEFATAYYTTLETKLASSSSPYFFGTDNPSYIDAILFAHLAEAVCDVHLILVLAKHTRLVQYFQKLYDMYFSSDYTKTFESSHGGSTDWIRKNNIANARNAFNKIPESVPSETTLSPEQIAGMSNAIQLMQQLAVHCHQLDEALKDAAKSRTETGEQATLNNSHRPIGSTLYKWCAGFWEGNATKNDISEDEGNMEAGNDETKEDMKSKWKAQMERMERDKRSSDETWVVGVIVAIFATVMISASSRTK